MTGRLLSKSSPLRGLLCYRKRTGAGVAVIVKLRHYFIPFVFTLIDLTKKKFALVPSKCAHYVKKKLVKLHHDNSFFFFVHSCDVSRVLEEKKCKFGSPLGLYGLSRGGRKTKAGLCRQSSLPGEKSHYWGQRTQFSSIKTVKKLFLLTYRAVKCQLAS